MTTTKKFEDVLGLDAGPPTPKPTPTLTPARRARGTAPLGEPITSGLIDMREMAAAYKVERPAADQSLPDLAGGTSPIALIAGETELAPLLEPDTGTRLPPLMPFAPLTSRRRLAITAVAIGGALVAAAVVAGWLLLRADQRTKPAAAPPPPVLEAPPLVIRAQEIVPEVRVIPLPTTVTEVAAPDQAKVRRPARTPRRAPR